MALGADWFAGDVHELARALIGTELLVGGVGGRIVEVEAYRQDDPASHSFRGETPRTRTMFGPPGRIYVYRSYGLHWCANLVCGPVGEASAVLLRALEPTRGLEEMQLRRGVDDPRLLCSGPGRLCQALGITGEDDGARIDRPPFVLEPRSGEVDVAVGVRIGITKAAEQPWRYGLAGSPYLSRPFSPGAR